MGHGGTECPQQVCSKSMKERGKSTNSKKRVNGEERGRRAVSFSSSSELTDSASGIRVIGCLDTAEPKPK